VVVVEEEGADDLDDDEEAEESESRDLEGLSFFLWREGVLVKVRVWQQSGVFGWREKWMRIGGEGCGRGRLHSVLSVRRLRGEASLFILEGYQDCERMQCQCHVEKKGRES